MSAVAIRPRKWRFFVCDVNGVRITTLGPWAKNKQMQFRLNKPDMLQFDVRSDVPEVATILADGFPIITKQRRTIQGYRHEPVAGVMTWVLRGGWIIWQTEDKAEGDSAFTAVTCYSPLIMLAKTPVTSPVGTIKHITIDGLDMGAVAVELIDDANAAAGF